MHLFCSSFKFKFKFKIPMQMAGGGGGVTAGIKKKKPRRRAKGAGNHSQRKDAARRDRSEHARHETSALPLGV
jgi:hypothetical protein